MYTLMKSEHSKIWGSEVGPRAYEQKEVAQYTALREAVAACDQANRERKARHYLMNDSGKEYYLNSWID
jgi:hypothetical protein